MVLIVIGALLVGYILGSFSILIGLWGRVCEVAETSMQLADRKTNRCINLEKEIAMLRAQDDTKKECEL